MFGLKNLKSKLKKTTVFLLVLCLVLGSASYWFYSSMEPNWDDLKNDKRETSRLYDSEGRIIAEYCLFCRDIATFDEIKQVGQVAITAEDKHFWTRPFAVDFFSIARAFFRNIWMGKIEQGGSTIDQQTARIIFLQKDVKESKNLYDKVKRKIKETLIAVHLKRSLPRNEIITIYLNNAYFGNGRYGVKAASRYYFKKELNQLEMPEMAMLVGLLRSPSSSPFVHPEKAKALRSRVLGQLVAEDLITKIQKTRYDKAPLPEKTPREKLYQHFSEYVRKEITSKGRLVDRGLNIQTTIRSDIQFTADEALKKSMSELKARNPQLTDLWGVAVMMDLKTGAIVAFVQEPEFRYNQFLIPQIKRQLGSAFKPFFYSFLISQGYRLTCEDEGTKPCMLNDVPLTIRMGLHQKSHTIENYPYQNMPRYLGWVQLRDAIAQSRNCATMWPVVKKLVKKEDIIDFIEQFGIVPISDPGLTVAIGSIETDPLTVISAYSGLIGSQAFPYSIEKVVYASGKDITPKKPQSRMIVQDENMRLAFLRVLRCPVEVAHGTAGDARRKLPFQVFGKTGTATNGEGEATENWFIGGSSQYIGAVVIFREKKLPLRQNVHSATETGGKNSLPVFIAMMETAHRNSPPPPFPEITDPNKPFRPSEQATQTQTQPQTQTQTAPVEDIR